MWYVSISNNFHLDQKGECEIWKGPPEIIVGWLLDAGLLFFQKTYKALYNKKNVST